MKYTLIALLVSFVSFAQAEVEFEGNIKNTNRKCSLHIIQTYFVNNVETPANFRAEVEAHLTGGHSHGEDLIMTVKMTNRKNLFSGKGSNNKDQLNIMQKEGATNMSDLNFYAARIWHHNHYDSAQCVNLKRVQE